MSKREEYYGSTASFANGFSWEGDGSNEFVDIIDSNALSFVSGGVDQPFSVGGWLKADTYTTFPTICSKGNLTTREYYLALTSAGRIRGGCSAPSGIPEIIAQSSSIYNGDAGAWHWYGMTYSGSETYAGLTLYRDGVAIATTNAGSGVYTGMTNGLGNAWIGMFMGSLGNCADGKIFHPFLLNKEASAAEMLAIYTKKAGDLRTILSIAPNIVFALRFTNGQADFTTWSDYTGNGHDGDMHNGEATDINTDVPT